MNNSSCGDKLEISDETCSLINSSEFGINFDWERRSCPFYGSQGYWTYLRGHFLIFLACVGIVLNLFNIPILKWVYYEKQKIFWGLLTALALSDVVENVIYITTYSVTYVDPDGHYINVFFLSNQPWILTLTSMTMTFNRWIIVVLTGNRCYIMRKASTGVTYQESFTKILKVSAIVAVVAVAAVVVNVWRLWEYDLVPCLTRVDGVRVESKMVNSSPTACSGGYLWFYATFFVLVVNNVVPFLMLVAFNVYIVAQLAVKRSSGLKTGGSDDQRRRRNATRMCVAVSVFYLLLQIPYLIETVQKGCDRFVACNRYDCHRSLCLPDMKSCPLKKLQSIHPDVTLPLLAEAQRVCRINDNPKCFCQRIFGEPPEKKSERFAFYKYLGMILNCSINFFIYVLFSETFRRTMLEKICRVKRRSEHDASLLLTSKRKGFGAGPGMSDVGIERLTVSDNPAATENPETEEVNNLDDDDDDDDDDNDDVVVDDNVNAVYVNDDGQRIA